MPIKTIAKLTLLTLISTLTLSSQAFAYANFSGQWISTEGKVSSNVGINSKCKKIEINIQQNDDQIVIERYSSNCNIYGSDWGPNYFQIKNGKVYEDEVEIGYINDTELVTKAQQGSIAYQFNLKVNQVVNNQVTSISSYYGVQNFTGTIATEAIMRKP